jgi:hypothetical protein
MNKKLIGYAIIIFVFLFPFRKAFLEYPANINVQNTMIDGGRVEYVIYFLLTVFGFLAFMMLTTSPGHGDEK